MCGLVGYFGVMSKERMAIFEDLLQIDVVRGMDSTGVAAIRRKHIAVVKDACLPQYLMMTKAYEKHVDNLENFCLIGHNRYATKGDISEKNSHPFKHGSITLVHNGTLQSLYELPDHRDFETDSETVCAAINKQGIEKTWGQIDGAAALVYWNSNDESLNMIRNRHRPLFYCTVGNGAGVFWASEIAMLRLVLERRNIAPDTDEKGIAYYYPETNKLTTWKFNKERTKVSFDIKVLEDIVATRQKKYQGNAYQYKGDGFKRLTAWNDYSDWAQEAPPEQKVLPFHTTSKTFGNKSSRDLETEVSTTSATDKSISEAQFHIQYKACCCCGESLEFCYEEAVIVDENKAVCGDCNKVAQSKGIVIR